MKVIILMTSKNYTDYIIPGSFGGVSGFLKNNKNLNKNTKSEILNNDVYTLHKPVRKKFQRCRLHCPAVFTERINTCKYIFKIIIVTLQFFSIY